MRILATLSVLFVLASTTALAEDVKTNTPIKIKASEAKANIGTNAIVTGKIAEVNKTERIIRLNFDEKYPKNTFTAVIFPDHMKEFSDMEKLQDKTVEVSGKITAYRDHPQIVVTSTNQLKVLEKTTEPEKK